MGHSIGQMLYNGSVNIAIKTGKKLTHYEADAVGDDNELPY